MKRLRAALSVRLERLTTRELVLAGAAVLLPAAYLWYALVIGPMLAERQALEARMQKERVEIATLEDAARSNPASADPEAGYRLRENELRKQLTAAEETLNALYKSLVPAQRMPTLLREMLSRDNALQLQSLRTLAVSPLMPEPSQASRAKDRTNPPLAPESREPSERGVYKHGVEITLRGSYSALHAYIQRLEGSPWAMYWWRAHLAADERAVLTMTITINTLSFDKAWLQL
jgi:MSHA biogenesis protein MshJ